MITFFVVFDYDYQKRFALALTFSLIATLIVFGAALFAFEYWKKKHYGEDYSSSSGGTNRVSSISQLFNN